MLILIIGIVSCFILCNEHNEMTVTMTNLTPTPVAYAKSLKEVPGGSEDVTDCEDNLLMNTNHGRDIITKEKASVHYFSQLMKNRPHAVYDPYLQ